MSHEHHPKDEELQTGSGVGRRDFLRLAGFSFAGAFLAGCQQGKIEKAIPFLIQPEEVTPGLAYWYSTTCTGCSAGCGVLAKNRDGRPIKLEGNPDHPISKGGLCAVGQASILSLYDSHRLKGPMLSGKEATWNEIDAQVTSVLSRIRQTGGRIRLLTGTITSPTTRAVITKFLSRYPNAKHVEYEAISYSAILDAHEITHGRRILPRYHFDRAQTIFSVDADFLGTWISPVEYTAGFRAGRTLEGTPPKFSHHTQIESRLSLTGSNADERIAVSPAEYEGILSRLAILIGEKDGRQTGLTSKINPEMERRVQRIADRLWQTRGRSLVVCGVNDLRLQLLANFANHLLDGYGNTVDVQTPSFQTNPNDAALQDVLHEIKAGDVGALFIAGGNPVYDLPEGETLGANMRKIPLVVSFAERMDETASAATMVCPTPHFLETWNDTEPVHGAVSLTQPTIPPLMKTRSFIESLSAWMGESQTAYDLIRAEWRSTVFQRQSSKKTFDEFWNDTLLKGFATVSAPTFSQSAFDLPSFTSSLNKTDVPKDDGSMMLVLHASPTMMDGRNAHNAWLQELPDPVTKTVWDNHASLSRNTAEKYGLAEGDIVKLEVQNGGDVELPVHIQPGQHDAVIAVALGYGRKGTDRFTNIGPDWIQARPTVPPGALVGKNMAPFVGHANTLLTYITNRVTISRTGRSYSLVASQEYNSLRDPNLLGEPTGERRPIVQEATLAAFSLDPSAGSFRKPHLETMWPEDHKYTGHRWGMAIDLNACTGCSACVVGCQVENNIPVVGKDEMRRNRDLTWIRIDRYYDENNDGSFSVSHQPMMCQHCGNAPCETVCPVLATVHNDEGLNQQVYNRCVGTRYCANNCPYKIRRFNWFEYKRGDEMQKMVLNPDVTVRDRGVMEKCSFCIQRIELAKIEARNSGTRLKDGDIQPACAQSCPAQAIVFGDMNDPESKVSKRMKNPRFYKVLEEIGVRPSVGYMTLIHDRPDDKEKQHHG